MDPRASAAEIIEQLRRERRRLKSLGRMAEARVLDGCIKRARKVAFAAG
jgi:hypothetical protein